ncbi:MAG TPA: UdgX family uracil-DNA binding protein [Pirellulales bacterium]|nr:UdgX family uracil-DNA binding protein [Pirellulales bacterium]
MTARPIATRSAADFLPASKTLAALARAAHDCQGCELYRNATQTVFGQGSAHAKIVFVGEQPGDREDIEGHPFVGPAGRLLDEGLIAAGVDRGAVYVTNAVKHFKWTPRGKRRLHSKPNSREIAACRPWLSAEFEAIEPQGIVCLGATAAQALLGRAFRITKQRGELLPSELASWIMATYHPSAVLRAPDEARRHQMRDELFADLKAAAKALAVPMR